jgi:ElaB/YqjD/DUF883 family membrane-anchored ribosome-binding protein
MSVDKSSSQVAHEAEDTRAHLASTLERLRDNLRPENVMEEVVTNARAGASQVADNLAEIARQHPLPSVLMAVGSALIMRVFSGKGEAARSGADAPRPPLLRNPTRFRPAPGRPSDGAADRPARDAADVQGRGFRTSVSTRAGDAMQTLSHAARDRGGARSKFADLLDEQPLILGVIGLAVGAAIGAALPITETEEHVMGGTAHRLRDSATDVARHEIDGLRAAAGEAVQNVRQSASDNLHDFVKDVGDSAKGVVDRAGESLGHGTRDV